MSDRPDVDRVLALIDGATGGGWAMPDAMRWVPEDSRTQARRSDLIVIDEAGGIDRALNGWISEGWVTGAFTEIGDRIGRAFRELGQALLKAARSVERLTAAIDDGGPRDHLPPGGPPQRLPMWAAPPSGTGLRPRHAPPPRGPRRSRR